MRQNSQKVRAWCGVNCVARAVATSNVSGEPLEVGREFGLALGEPLELAVGVRASGAHGLPGHWSGRRQRVHAAIAALLGRVLVI